MSARREMVPPREIYTRHPGLNGTALMRLRRSGEVYAEPDPSHTGYYLYDYADIEELLADSMTCRPLRTLENGAWLWVVKVPEHRKYRMSLHSLSDWAEHCFALGRPLEIRTVWFIGHCVRSYVRCADLDKIRKFLDHDTPAPEDDQPWASFEQAEALGFHRAFLAKYAETEGFARTTTGKPHPLLGRLIITRSATVVRGGCPREVVQYWRKDLSALRTEVVREHWMTRREAVADAGVSNGRIDYYRDDSKVRRRTEEGPKRKISKTYPLLDGLPLREKMLPAVVKQGRAGKVLHFWREDIAKLRKGSPRPGAADRCHTDAFGNRWWPLYETAERIGVQPWECWNWREECKYLPLGADGLPQGLPRKRERLKLFRSKHGPLTWVYSEAYADLIHARMHGLPDPRPAVQKVELIEDHRPIASFHAPGSPPVPADVRNLAEVARAAADGIAAFTPPKKPAAAIPRDADVEWWKGPKAMDLGMVVAQLKLGDLTAKEKSKVMEKIRARAGGSLRCQKVNGVWVYHGDDWVAVRRLIRSSSSRKDDDRDGLKGFTDGGPDRSEREEIEQRKAAARTKKEAEDPRRMAG